MLTGETKITPGYRYFIMDVEYGSISSQGGFDTDIDPSSLGLTEIKIPENLDEIEPFASKPFPFATAATSATEVSN